MGVNGRWKGIRGTDGWKVWKRKGTFWITRGLGWVLTLRCFIREPRPGAKRPPVLPSHPVCMASSPRQVKYLGMYMYYSKMAMD